MTSLNTHLSSWDTLCGIGNLFTRTKSEDDGGNFGTDLKFSFDQKLLYRKSLTERDNLMMPKSVSPVSWWSSSMWIIDLICRIADWCDFDLGIWHYSRLSLSVSTGRTVDFLKEQKRENIYDISEGHVIPNFTSGFNYLMILINVISWNDWESGS
jgi:hypothetical protein